MRKKLKRRDQLGKVESVADINIEDYFFYLQKDNRKRMEKAYTGVKFDQILLSLNDDGVREGEEYPFEKQKMNLKLH